MKKVLYRSLLVGASVLALSRAAYADPTYADSAGYTGEVKSAGTVHIRGNTDELNGVLEGVWITSNGSSTVPSNAEAAIEINGTLNEEGAKVAGEGQVTIYGKTVMTGGAAVNGATNINTSAGDTAATTIGRDGNKTSLNSNDIEIGTGKYATTVAIGSTSATSVTTTANTSINSTVGNGALNIVESGSGMVVDGKGRITTGTVNGNTASLTTSNGTTTNGIVAQQNQTVISGGNTTGTSLTLRDNGATFSNSLNGAPVRVMGVADGVASYDAVNVRQLRGVYAGIAGTAAMANIPAVDQGKRFALGVGLGGFKGQGAVAVGASLRLTDNAQIKASVSTSTNTDTGSRNTAFAIGGGLSF